MNKQSLLEFIAKAHRHTYAAPKEVSQKYKVDPILPGHRDYHFVEGEWSYHDSYAGIAWAPGREVVFFKDNPVWTMSYQGKTVGDHSEDFFDKEVFGFLKKAMMSFDDSMPFRGPSEFEEGDFRYEFKIEGDVEYFTGRETIFYKGEEVFFQDVMGEMVK